MDIIVVFGRQFKKYIPSSVKRAINLFWSGANDAVEIIEKYADKSDKANYEMQLRHKSLNATTLKYYDRRLYYGLLTWFVNNAYEIAKLSFSMGAALNSDDWSDFVWYINLLGENALDDIFHIEEICDAVQCVAKEETYFGTKTAEQQCNCRLVLYSGIKTKWNFVIIMKAYAVFLVKDRKLLINRRIITE